MARLQILELPEGTGDKRPPFVLVIDQAPRDETSSAFRRDLEDNRIAAGIGARHVLVFEDTIDIPANDTTAYLQQVAEETGATIGKITSAFTGRQLADERADIARDMDRLAKWKNELTDALGMDHTRDWDDVRNAAAGIRKQRDDQAAKIERILRLPETPQEGNGYESGEYLNGYAHAIRWVLATLINPTDDQTTADA